MKKPLDWSLSAAPKKAAKVDPKENTFSTYVPREIQKAVKVYAAQNERTVADVTAAALSEYLAHHADKLAGKRASK